MPLDRRLIIGALVALTAATAPALAYTPAQTTVLDNIAVAVAARQTCPQYDVSSAAVLIELMGVGLGPDALKSIALKAATARARDDADRIGHATFCREVGTRMGPDSPSPMLDKRSP